MKVVGFEGTWAETAPVTWGAAALQAEDGAPVVNSVTRLHVTEAEFKSLAKSGLAVTSIPRLKVDQRDEAPLVVVAVRRTFSLSRLFLSEMPSLARRTSQEHVYYVFTHPDQFARFAGQMAASVSAHLLASTTADKESLLALRGALSVAPHDPLLHAVRLFYTPNELATRVELMARASLRGEKAIAEFEDYRTALLEGKGS